MGSQKSKTKQVTNQATNQALGSTPTALAALPDYTADFQAGMSALPNPMQVTDYVAGMSPTSTEGLNLGKDWIRNSAPGIQQSATDINDYWGSVARGDFVDDNPYLDNLIDKTGEESSKIFARNANMFRNQSIDAGAYGDTNYARGATWMTKEQDANTKAQIADLRYQNYLNEMNRRGQAATGISQGINLGLQPTQALDMIGERERAGEQLDIDNRLQSVSAPLDLWGTYFGTLGGPAAFGSNGTMSGTSSSTQTQNGGLRDVIGALGSVGGAMFEGPAGLALGAGNKLAKSASGLMAAPPTVNFSSMVNWANPQGLNYRG